MNSAARQGEALSGDRPIRVLFVMIHMAMGGTERLIFNLVRNLDRRLFEPSVAWFVEDQPLREFATLGIPLYRVPKRGRFDWGAMRELSRIVRSERIDVINAHHFMPFFYSCYAGRIANRTGLIYTEHSEADVLSVRGKWKAIGRHLLRSCDAAVGVSDAVSRRLTSHFQPDPAIVHTIENGVDLEMFTDDHSRRNERRGEFGFLPQHIVIGHVANFRRNKNHVFLLKAFREIARSRDDVRLLLVGQGFEGDAENSAPEIISFIRDNGLGDAVNLAGYCPNVQDVLGMLDVFCLVSHKEGLPLSLIEAMASGLPVVGTDIEGIRGVVEPEVNGLMVPPDDVPALTKTLNRLIDDAALRRRQGLASRRIAHEKYSLTRCVQKTEHLFASVTPGRAMPLVVDHSTAG